MSNYLDYLLFKWGNYKLTTATTASILLLVIIDRLFREMGITIPFPQRDLHLKTNSISSL